MWGKYRDKLTSEEMAKKFYYARKTIDKYLIRGMKELRERMTTISPGASYLQHNLSKRYRNMPYPENLLWHMGIDWPPEQYPLLEKAILELPEKSRSLVWGKYRDKMSGKEMGDMFLYSTSAINYQCRKAVRELKERLGATRHEDEAERPAPEDEAERPDEVLPAPEHEAERPDELAVAEDGGPSIIFPKVEMTCHDFIKQYIRIKQRIDYTTRESPCWEETYALIMNLQIEMEDTGDWIRRALYSVWENATGRVRIEGYGEWQIDFPSQLFEFLRVKKENLISDHMVKWE